ncbi:MAG TPA: hypothetical protein VGJ03_09035 [Acidimicrobiales bacterium]|jgi:hypothetical protein
MTTITDTLTAAQDQILDAIEKVQEPTVDAITSVVEAVEGVLPDDRPTVPFADQLPDPKELVELSFAFAQKVLDNQHEFVKAIVAAVSPLLPAAPKVTKPAPAKKAAA